MNDDNRRFSRIPFQMHTEIVISGKRYVTDDITNLSIGGCLLPLQIKVEPKTPCQITIRLEGTTEDMGIRIEGEIVRTIPEGLAINFVRIDPDSLYHLQNIVKYNSPDADVIESEINKHPGIR